MIMVQSKYSTINDKGNVEVLNLPPEDSNQQRQVADIYRCSKDAAVHGSVPIPKSFPVSEIRQENGVFSFISQNNAVAGTVMQIEKAMYDAIFAIDGASETLIERCFFNIPSTVVDDRPAKTAAENLPIEDIIGTFTFDESVQSFSTTYKTGDYSFELVINTDTREEALKFLPLVRDTITRLDAVDSIAKGYAAEELLELKNDTWLEDDEDPVTQADFAARMSIESITFDDEGGYEIWYADGNLFWGHCICVSMDCNGKPTEADIHG